ncbi:hypothetical protein DVH05_017173 [Phytophthora capsici]|nr:hypothetical protein DVH05_017173 [Phytophthora capsici]
MINIKPVDSVNDTVGDLKNTIADYQKFDFAANKLQLFPAKKEKGNGSWLTCRKV